MNARVLLLILIASWSVSCAGPTDAKMRRNLRDNYAGLRDLGVMARHDFLDYSLSRVSAHELMTTVGQSWSLPLTAKDYSGTGAKDHPLPPKDEARLRKYLAGMAPAGISCVLVSMDAVVLQASGPSLFNGEIAKSYFIGTPSSFESIIPFDARWPTHAYLSSPGKRSRAYKKLENGWYIEMRYFPGFL